MKNFPAPEGQIGRMLITLSYMTHLPSLAISGGLAWAEGDAPDPSTLDKIVGSLGGYLLGGILTLALLLVGIAFWQGREIAFWPPRIGPIVARDDRAAQTLQYVVVLPEEHDPRDILRLLALLADVGDMPMDFLKPFGSRSGEAPLLVVLLPAPDDDVGANDLWSLLTSAVRRSHRKARMHGLR